MPITRSGCKKRINVEIPVELHTMLKKLAADLGVTTTEVIVRYLKYLKAKKGTHRKALNEKSPAEFKLDSPNNNGLQGPINAD